MRKKRNRKHSKGQAIVEYIIIVVIVAIAALAILGIFSDRVRAIIGGAASELGAEQSDPVGSSTEFVKSIGTDDSSTD